MFKILYYESAKAEKNTCCDTYSAEDAKNLNGWLGEIAEAATAGSDAISHDALAVLERMRESRSDWKCSWEKWRQVEGTKKLESLLYVLRHRKPPWHYRMTMRWLPFLDGVFTREVHAYYFVDAVAREVTFVKFHGLPPGPEVDA